MPFRKKQPESPVCGVYEVRVKDTGIGMTRELAETVFEAFARERTSTVSRIQGTGLGMAITKSIVDAGKCFRGGRPQGARRRHGRAYFEADRPRPAEKDAGGGLCGKQAKSTLMC